MSTTVPVTLIFEGVMVGRYDEANKTYEMGVLPVPSHTFSIAIEEHGPPVTGAAEPPLIKSDDITFNEIEITPDNANWRLEIPGSAPSASLFLPDATPPDRTIFPDDGFAKLDYRWVVNLEKEFPGHSPDGTTELPRHDNLLKPVLNITMGEFHATDIFPAFVSFRQGGKGNYKDFGFVPQQVVSNFTLDAGKEVLLKMVDSDKDVFRLKAQADHSYTIFFRNTPPDEQGRASSEIAEDELPETDINRPTHFQLIYLLFNVPPQKRYELRVLPTPATPLTNIAALAIANEFIAPRPRRLGVPTPRCAPTGTGG